MHRHKTIPPFRILISLGFLKEHGDENERRAMLLLFLSTDVYPPFRTMTSIATRGKGSNRSELTWRLWIGRIASESRTTMTSALRSPMDPTCRPAIIFDNRIGFASILHLLPPPRLCLHFRLLPKTPPKLFFLILLRPSSNAAAATSLSSRDESLAVGAVQQGGGSSSSLSSSSTGEDAHREPSSLKRKAERENSALLNFRSLWQKLDRL